MVEPNRCQYKVKSEVVLPPFFVVEEIPNAEEKSEAADGVNNVYSTLQSSTQFRWLGEQRDTKVTFCDMPCDNSFQKRVSVARERVDEEIAKKDTT